MLKKSKYKHWTIYYFMKDVVSQLQRYVQTNSHNALDHTFKEITIQCLGIFLIQKYWKFIT